MQIIEMLAAARLPSGLAHGHLGTGINLFRKRRWPGARQRVMVCLTAAPASRCEKLGQCLWPTEKLGVDEVARHLLPEHLLWAESERGMVEVVRERLWEPGA